MANAASSTSSPRAGSSSSSLPPSPPAALPEELVEDILLRFPPEEPASLLRAALVCKRWGRLVSGRGFRRRFREFHRTPPMLGIFCNRRYTNASRFVPTTAFGPHHAVRPDMLVLDVRHGRVLLLGPGKGGALVVWDPITDEEWKVPFPPQYTGALSWTATVLCSAAAAGAGGCDHLDCHRRPFILVFVASVRMAPDSMVTFIYTYSSNAAAWSEPTCGQRPNCVVNFRVRSALAGNTLYFESISEDSIILKYNMQSRQMSWIELPYSGDYCRLSALTATEDGGLQVSIEEKAKLYIWSTKDADEVEARWEQNRVIELNTLLPDGTNFVLLDVVGSTDGLRTIFLRADDVSYAIDLKTYKVKKVCKDTVSTIIPYMSFYTPELEVACTGEEPSASGSNARQN